MIPKDIKEFVLKMSPPKGVCGSQNVKEWMIEKAAEMGYLLALYHIGGMNETLTDIEAYINSLKES